MIPVDFPEANNRFGAPKDMSESQVGTIPVYAHKVLGGSCDGCVQIVTAWRPTEEELATIIAGGPIYFSSIGGLPPHYLSTDFHTATHPA